jgi:hypothetical protein
VQRVVTAIAILTRPTLAIILHPPDPPIASQSITRDARFAQARTDYIMVPPSSLAIPVPYGCGCWRRCDLGWMHGLSLWSPSSLPYLGTPTYDLLPAMVKRSVRRSVRRSQGRTKFAEPSNDRAMRFIQRWSRRRPSTSYDPTLGGAPVTHSYADAENRGVDAAL